MIQYDFVVIGSGIAGLSFALKAAGHGSVAIVTKRARAESNTAYAQGGIACVTSAGGFVRAPRAGHARSGRRPLRRAGRPRDRHGRARRASRS